MNTIIIIALLLGLSAILRLIAWKLNRKADEIGKRKT